MVSQKSHQSSAKSNSVLKGDSSHNITFNYLKAKKEGRGEKSLSEKIIKSAFILKGYDLIILFSFVLFLRWIWNSI